MRTNNKADIKEIYNYWVIMEKIDLCSDSPSARFFKSEVACPIRYRKKQTLYTDICLDATSAFRIVTRIFDYNWNRYINSPYIGKYSTNGWSGRSDANIISNISWRKDRAALSKRWLGKNTKWEYFDFTICDVVLGATELFYFRDDALSELKYIRDNQRKLTSADSFYLTKIPIPMFMSSFEALQRYWVRHEQLRYTIGKKPFPLTKNSLQYDQLTKKKVRQPMFNHWNPRKKHQKEI